MPRHCPALPPNSLAIALLGALFSVLLLAAPPAAAQASPGRLFLTPEQRALLDTYRRNKLRMAPLGEATGNVRLDGIVRRSSGRQTVWINGQPYQDRAPVVRNDERSARVLTGNQRGVDLKVGESLRIEGGEVAPSQP